MANSRKRGRSPPASAVHDAPGGSEPASMLPPSPRVVYFSATDSQKLFEISRSVVESVDCRMTSMLRHDEPFVAADGRLFYRSGLRRAVLLTLLQSLEFGRLALVENCSVAEALLALDFNCIGYADRGPRSSLVLPPLHGVAFQKRETSYRERLDDICARVADAILAWPRLEGTLHAAFAGADAVAASPSACFVHFAEKLPLGERFDREKPYLEILAAIGVAHARSVGSAFAIPPANFDKAAFRKLSEDVSRNSLISVAFDFHKSQTDKAVKLDLARGERFSSWVRQTLVENAGLVENARAPCHCFASAVSNLAHTFYRESANMGVIFGGIAANERGNTPERAALKRALSERGVALLRWEETWTNRACAPLVYPPFLRHVATRAGPTALLSFEKLR